LPCKKPSAAGRLFFNGIFGPQNFPPDFLPHINRSSDFQTIISINRTNFARKNNAVPPLKFPAAEICEENIRKKYIAAAWQTVIKKRIIGT